MNRLKLLPLSIPLLLLLSSFFRVKTIECYTQFGLCSDTHLRNFSPLKNTLLVRPVPSSFKRGFLSSYPQVKKISFHRRFPKTLVVILEVRRPVAAVSPEVLSAQVALIDETGTILSHSSSTSLPRLIADTHSPYLTPAITTLNLLQSSESVRLSYSLDGSVLSATYPGGSQILLDVTKKTDSWYPSLQFILKKAKIDGKIPQKIDMRFNRPILTY